MPPCENLPDFNPPKGNVKGRNIVLDKKEFFS